MPCVRQRWCCLHLFFLPACISIHILSLEKILPQVMFKECFSTVNIFCIAVNRKHTYTIHKHYLYMQTAEAQLVYFFVKMYLQLGAPRIPFIWNPFIVNFCWTNSPWVGPVFVQKLTPPHSLELINADLHLTL